MPENRWVDELRRSRAAFSELAEELNYWLANLRREYNGVTSALDKGAAIKRARALYKSLEEMMGDIKAKADKVERLTQDYLEERFGERV